MNFKNINIGALIRQRVLECNVENERICNFFKCNEDAIEKMYISESIDTDILLKWCKILEYDFFRYYVQHLILYDPQSSVSYNKTNKKSALHQFRKNIYTKELIVFILEQIEAGVMTKLQVIEHYNIPKTTLYKWIEKYK